MISHKITSLITACFLFVSMPVWAFELDKEAISERLAYHADFDPTTVFLKLDEIEQAQAYQMGVDLVDYAKTFIGRPYRRGSKGPNAFDCSGFTSYIYRNFDIHLNSSSQAQYMQGEGIDITEAQPGDLLFFSGRSASASRVGHVAIVVDVDDNGKVTFIHAATSGGIRYDTYPDGGYYSRRYIGARRVITE